MGFAYDGRLGVTKSCSEMILDWAELILLMITRDEKADIIEAEREYLRR